MVHVSLNELKCFVFNHLSGFWIKHTAQLLDLLTAETFTFLVSLIERLSNDVLDISKTLNTLPHAKAEVSKPFVVQSNSPVFAKELDSVWNDAILIAVSQLIQVVFVKTYKTPQALQDDFFVTHIGN